MTYSRVPTNGYDILTAAHFGGSVDGLGGDDDIFGDGNNNDLSGGAGNDYIFGKGGADTLNGGDNDDRLFGGNVGFFAFGGSNDLGDTIYGGAGDDYLHGEAGNDYLVGGIGDDTLVGGSGKDVLVGGTEQDTLTGAGKQGDRLTGGSNSDWFVIENITRKTIPVTITDFNPAEDFIVYQKNLTIDGDSVEFDYQSKTLLFTGVPVANFEGNVSQFSETFNILDGRNIYPPEIDSDL